MCRLISGVEDIGQTEWSAESPLYSSEIRDSVTLSKEDDATINKRRSQLLIPGSQLPETAEEARLPILLLARPPTCSAEYGQLSFMLVFNSNLYTGVGSLGFIEADKVLKFHVM